MSVFFAEVQVNFRVDLMKNKTCPVKSLIFCNSNGTCGWTRKKTRLEKEVLSASADRSRASSMILNLQNNSIFTKYTCYRWHVLKSGHYQNQDSGRRTMDGGRWTTIWSRTIQSRNTLCNSLRNAYADVKIKCLCSLPLRIDNANVSQ